MLALPLRLLKIWLEIRPAVARVAGAGAIPAAVGVACLLAALLGLALRTRAGDVAVLWPAGGIATGALMVSARAARWRIAAAVAAAIFAANLVHGRSVPLSAFSAAANTAEFLLAAWLLLRWLGGDPNLGTLRSVLAFLAAVPIATATGACASLVLALPQQLPAAALWLHWFTSDSLGMIAAAPLMMALRERPSRGEVIEGSAALVVLVVLTGAIVVLPPARWEILLSVLVFPVLLWIASRCPPLFSAAAAFVHSLTIVSAVTFGIGSLADTSVPLTERILVAQVIIAGAAMSTYVLGALFAERRRHATAIKESEARLQEALKAGAVTAFEWNPRTGVAQRSENAAQILGLGPDAAATFSERIHPGDRGAFHALVSQVGVDNPAYSATFRFIRPDGREVWLEETARGEFDAGGRLVRIKGLTRDITQRKRAEERQDLLIAELDHRVKNVLARVAVVTMYTRQGQRTIDDFVKSLDGRLKSMSAAHALLSHSRWCGVGLTDLMHRQLAPYTSDANTTLSGPDVMLTPAETQALAMVMHELVTNAAKYGALSVPQGRVSVTWTLAGAKPTTLTVHWRERGGPPITATHDASYGSRLIRDLIPHELDGEVELTFPVEGATCTIVIRLNRRED